MEARSEVPGRPVGPPGDGAVDGTAAIEAPYDTDRVATVPNALSFLRLAGVPVVVWLIVGPQADWIAVAVLGAAGLTDWLDGYLARRWRQTSRVGQLLDPVADRLYILAVVAGLVARDLVPWWVVVVLVARDLMVAATLPALRRRGISALPVHRVGKIATACLLYAFPLVLLGAGTGDWALIAWAVGWVFAAAGVVGYWWAGLLYLRQALRVMRELPSVRAGATPGPPR